LLSTLATIVGGGSEGTGAFLASLLQEGLAVGRLVRFGSLGLGLAVEVATVGDGLGVLVQDEGELFFGRAHAVSSVRLVVGGVPINAGAVLAILFSADVAEDLAIVLLVDIVTNDAGESVHHASASLSVGSRGQRRGNGTPALVNLRALGSSSVGGVVVVHLDTAGVDFGDLLLEVLEVLVRLDVVAINGDKTYYKLAPTHEVRDLRHIPYWLASSKYM
jgi:hypothetical protein